MHYKKETKNIIFIFLKIGICHNRKDFNIRVPTCIHICLFEDGEGRGGGQGGDDKNARRVKAIVIIILYSRKVNCQSF